VGDEFIDKSEGYKAGKGEKVLIFIFIGWNQPTHTVGKGKRRSPNQ
jgi:hypothetical protein